MEPTSATGLTVLKQAQIQRAAMIKALVRPGELSLSMTKIVDEATRTAKADIGGHPKGSGPGGTGTGDTGRLVDLTV